MRHLVCTEIGQPYFTNLVKHLEKMQEEKVDVYVEPSYFLNFSTFFYTAGDLNRSLEIIEWGLSIFEKEESLIIEKCKLLILSHDYMKAAVTLEHLKDPECPYALFERVKIAMLTKQYKEAKKIVEKIRSKIKSEENLLIQLTFFLAVNHMLKQAHECWEVVNKHPSYSFNYQLTYIALLYEEGEYKKAHQICLKLFKKNPNHLVISLYHSHIYYKMHMYNKAYKCINHLKKLHPNNIYASRLEEILEKIIR